MNLKQYYQFFKIAVRLTQSPAEPIFTDDQKVYDVVREKFPKARIMIVGKKVK